MQHKINLGLLILLLFTSVIGAQEKKQKIGKISYVSSKNVYVKYSSTKGIEKGDKLYTKTKGELIPVLIVKFLSSSSVSGSVLNNYKLKVGDKIIALVKDTNEIVSQEQPKEVVETESQKEISTRNIKYNLNLKNKSDLAKNHNSFYGRIAVSSYANVSNTNLSDYVRWRYTLSLGADRINNSKFSFDSYISFNYRSTDWASVKNNIGNALKIYALSVKYDFSENTSLVFGRKINHVITNISTIDGLQFESKIGNIKYGLIAGSRPNFSDYGWNSKLFEYGAYISQSSSVGSGNMQNSIAVFQQTNNFTTDRRFVYLQHNNTLIKNINLFFSSEIDLYKKINGISKSTVSLTGLFTSLRYRPSRFLSFSATYDQRKNVIYYETYKTYADSLLDSATRQGLRFRINLRPFNRLSFNFGYGYRTMRGDTRSSINYIGGFSFSRLPIINATISSTYNLLRTSYLDGNIISVRLSKNLFSNKIYSTFGYRKLKYSFLSGNSDLDQNIFSIDLNWSILHKLNLNFSYEGVVETTTSYGRVYFNVTKRF